jgi:hypothetical protein
VSPIRRDWLERLLQQLADVLARALGHRTRGQEAEAVEEIHRALSELFGIPRGLLLSLPPSAALDVLADARLRAAAFRLLEEEVSLLRFQGKVADADALAAWLARTRAAGETD